MNLERFDVRARWPGRQNRMKDASPYVLKRCPHGSLPCSRIATTIAGRARQRDQLLISEAVQKHSNCLQRF